MALALEEAQAAASRGEVPVGAVLLGPDGELLAKAGNEVRANNDPTAHAERLVLTRAAQKHGTSFLTDCDLWVTLEPCAMCAGAISLARIRRLYFGAEDSKGGAVLYGPRLFSQPTCHHRPEVYSGFQESEASELLRSFFAARRS
ncbi:hypothetical protein CAPTEDRAFT_145340 [Capitella teleta]|uniref:tRNA-specific adenosine deaminase 2 n=1 Tax=Capitella teleta TaxID=283909 RepID=R7TC64_CAPTE|nr:hypothetical protein CAPTEDRAFT_145340 [Capitella teleta]|eukprot:ELT91107.1 hypothetical protein CAPTEDRAFT_145340 [Capitella teleta]